jgi:hypothetical protein
MSYRFTATIHAGDYKVDSYGNGAAYLVTEGIHGPDLWFQGDDAEALRAELDAADEAGRPRDDVLADYFDALNPVAAECFGR